MNLKIVEKKQYHLISDQRANGFLISFECGGSKTVMFYMNRYRFNTSEKLYNSLHSAAILPKPNITLSNPIHLNGLPAEDNFFSRFL